jgi:hypothetical protein
MPSKKKQQQLNKLMEIQQLREEVRDLQKRLEREKEAREITDAEIKAKDFSKVDTGSIVYDSEGQKYTVMGLRTELNSLFRSDVHYRFFLVKEGQGTPVSKVGVWETLGDLRYWLRAGGYLSCEVPKRKSDIVTLNPRWVQISDYPSYRYSINYEGVTT